MKEIVNLLREAFLLVLKHRKDFTEEQRIEIKAHLDVMESVVWPSRKQEPSTSVEKSLSGLGYVAGGSTGVPHGPDPKFTEAAYQASLTKRSDKP